MTDTSTQTERSFEHLELEHVALTVLRRNPGVRSQGAFREVLFSTLQKEFFYSEEKLAWATRVLDEGAVKLPRLE